MTHHAHRTAALLGLSLAIVLTGCAANTAGAEDTAPVIAGSPVSASPAASTPAPKSLRGTLVSIIDGDHVELLPVSDKNGDPTGEPKVTVHILGIKAPALDACGGPAAAAELKRITAAGGLFRVRYDAQSARADSNGDVQGYLAAGDGNGVSMNLGPSMIRNGFAAAWYDPSDHAKDYADYSTEMKTVQAQKRGIWATCPATVG